MSRTSIGRREFLQATAALAAGAWVGCSKKPGAGRAIDNMIVLGVDGMDPNLARKFIAAGKMPNCKKLMEMGSFSPLKTVDPPQSPVAWSNFISGTNPGGHGIFDFIHRDAKKLAPYHAVSVAREPGHSLEWGNWVIPLSSGGVDNLRHGPTFWNDLQGHGVDCTIFRVPANFPPSEGDSTSLSGMGTPDLMGGYGIFTYFTDDSKTHTHDVSGGKINRVFVRDGVIKDALARPPQLPGPPNSFLKSQDEVSIPFEIFVDQNQRAAKIVVQDKKFILKEGEWSDWIVLNYTLVPVAAEVSGICRFFLKSAKGPFALYVTPINIDPANPSLPISTPPDYSKRLVRDVGYFYTQGMIEDTNALSGGALTPDEYCQQAELVINEQMRFYDYELNRFHGGFLFFYLSTLDRSCHVCWQTQDPQHPLNKKSGPKPPAGFIASLYAKVDEAIGKALARVDERTHLMVLSDHGFTSFRRQFDLNGWLLQKGYLRSKEPPNARLPEGMHDFDWNGTKAYGLGINGLYLNLKDREREGIVAKGDAADKLTDELVTRLKEERDPDTGAQMISNVFKTRDIYSGPFVDQAPDLIVGYNNFYRASWATALGGCSKEVVMDNTEAWCGDHCVDSQFVPGVLFSSRKLATPTPRIEDLAPTILTEFGVPIPAGMTGKPLA